MLSVSRQGQGAGPCGRARLARGDFGTPIIISDNYAARGSFQANTYRKSDENERLMSIVVEKKMDKVRCLLR